MSVYTDQDDYSRPAYVSRSGGHGRIETTSTQPTWHRSYDQSAQSREEIDYPNVHSRRAVYSDSRPPPYRKPAYRPAPHHRPQNISHGHSASHDAPNRYGASYELYRQPVAMPESVQKDPHDDLDWAAQPRRISRRPGDERVIMREVRSRSFSSEREPEDVYAPPPRRTTFVSDANESTELDATRTEHVYERRHSERPSVSRRGVRSVRHTDVGDGYRTDRIPYADEDDEPVFYSFSPPGSHGHRHSDSIGLGLSETESTLAADEEEREPAGDHDGKEPGLEAYHVLESEYTGDGYEEGHHSAKLTSVPSRQASVPQSMFRWIHFTRTTMDIDDFSAQAAAIPGLSRHEKNGLQNMIASVKRDHVKTIQNADGRNARYLEPKLRHDPLVSDSGAVGSQSVTWICLPYFSLEPYSGFMAAKNTKSFPPPTLLQSTISRTRRDRDMEQAVCKLKGTPAGNCFHVAQLWCLILDNSLLLTYGRISKDSLCQGIITNTVTPFPHRDPTTSLQTPQDPKFNKTLLVRYQGSIVWSIPVEECQTWFSFVSHFGNYRPHRLQFFYHSKVVSAKDWPKFHRLAARRDKKLTLDLQPGPPLKPSRLQKLNPIESPKESQTQPKAPSVPSTAGNVATVQVAVGAKQEGEVRAPSQRQQEHGNRSSGLLAPSSTGERPRSSSPSPLPNRGMFDFLECFADYQQPPSSASPPTPQASTKDHFIIRYFFDIDKHLETKTTPADRQAYKNCTKLTQAELYGRLEAERDLKESATARRPAEEAWEDRVDFETRVSLFNLAGIVFKFFFHPDSRLPTIRKYWGAVQGLVNVSWSTSTETKPDILESQERSEPYDRYHAGRYHPRPPLLRRLDDLVTEFRGMAADILAFNEVCTNLDNSDREQIRAPLTLVNAWMHLILSLATFPKDEWRSLDLAERARADMKSVMDAVITARSNPLRLQNLVVLPFDLVSLIGMKLMRDATPGGLPNITTTYVAYLDSLDSEIGDKPDRRIEHKLGLLQQELTSIDLTVDLQEHIINGILTTLDSMAEASENQLREQQRTTGQDNRKKARIQAVQRVREYHRRPRHSTMASMAEAILGADEDACGFSQMLLHEGLKQLALKRSDVKLLGDSVAHLTAKNRNKLNYTKDRQELAIYAFTIVTAIFLPLSAVASIFGMNSSDVRDMEVGQWVYWATALPVTFLVLILGLWFTGELGGVARWVAGILPVEISLRRRRRRMDGGRKKWDGGDGEGDGEGYYYAEGESGEGDSVRILDADGDGLREVLRRGRVRRRPRTRGVERSGWT